jgi:hypothetical protein
MTRKTLGILALAFSFLCMAVLGFTRHDLAATDKNQASLPFYLPTPVPRRTNPSDPKPLPYKNPSDPKPKPSPYKNPSDPTPKPSPYKNPSDPKPTPSPYKNPSDPTPTPSPFRNPSDPKP